ncbi:MAG: DUF2318 domain-containing protein [Desulfobacterales bacterium]|nr:DUF2318 domain-containing protein [Desulfobacterales bacterium]
MKKTASIILLILMISLTVTPNAFSLWGIKFNKLTPANGVLSIPVSDINDGKAHYYKVKADDGIMTSFFVLKSSDGVIRAAIDACDVCYRSGKGYVQEGDFMVCTNCGRRFASTRINEIKGGCNPAPLNRKILGKNLVIAMKDINANSWYSKFKKQ